MLLSPMTSFSQVNIETLRNESKNKNKKVLGEIKLGMEFKIGNVNITKTTSSMLIHYFHDKHHVFSKISHNWSSQNKKTFEKNYFGHFRWTFMGTKKIGLEGEWFDYNCVGSLPDDLYELIEWGSFDDWWENKN